SITRVLKIPEYLSDIVVKNKNIEIRSCIVDYLNFQQHSDFKHLNLKEMMYNFLMENIVKIMDKKSVATDDDYDDKPATDTNIKETLDALKQMDKLYEEIESLRKRFSDKFEYA